MHELDATEIVKRFAQGDLGGADYAQALLARVDDVEEDVQAWTHLPREQFLAGAAAPLANGPLAGIPVGIKDIIDVAAMPTGDGTPLHAGRMATADAALVRRLRQAGALVMGKTVTTELATYAPGKTRNPHRSAQGIHTPGGSSSGSAAAVAAGMVPLAVGTQTNGSVIRPASFCGVYGFKPSAGLIDRQGVLQQSPSLDQVGVFARTLRDVALITGVLCDQSRAPAPAPAAPMRSPRWAVVRTPFWQRVEPDARDAFERMVKLLGEHAQPAEIDDMAGAVACHKTIMEKDIAASFAHEYEQGRAQLSSSLQAQIERGRGTNSAAYREAVDRVPAFVANIDQVLDRFDAIITPATLGTAPAGLEGTGDPIMCTAWTLAGLPAISLPLLRGANGLPIGVQLVGRKGGDADLLRAANWLVDWQNSGDGRIEPSAAGPGLRG